MQKKRFWPNKITYQAEGPAAHQLKQTAQRDVIAWPPWGSSVKL